MKSCRDPRPNLGLGKLEFTNKHYSVATGLYYYFERWYDPSVGCFVNQDPLPGYASDPQSLNPYVYVENTPTSLVDPTGAYDEYSYNREIGSVFLPDEPPILTADFFKNIETEYLVESENSALARISPTAGAQTTLDQFTTEPNTGGIGNRELVPTSDFFANVEEGGGSPATGWRLGSPVNVYTESGNYPSWSAVRQRFWKNEALNNPAEYSYNSENLGRMQRGRAAFDEEGRAFQIHHINGRDISDPHNPANLEVLTWLQHYLRHYFPVEAY